MDAKGSNVTTVCYYLMSGARQLRNFRQDRMWWRPRSAANPRPANLVFLYMAERKTCWETFKAEGANVIDKLNNLIREGNVRRVVVEHNGRNVAEFPLTVGVVGAVIAPVAALVGVLVAILQDCTIKVEREVTATEDTPPAPASEVA